MQRATCLIGRDRELDVVAAAADRARGGSGGLVAITGPAGIGKSALVRHALADATDVVLGRATPPPSPTCQPLADLALALVRRGADPTAEDLRLHRGALRVLLPGADLGVGETEQPTPMHVVDALIDLATQLAQRRPHVVVIEDLHWADELVLQGVDHLADRLPGTDLLVLVTTRLAKSSTALVQRIARRHRAEHIELPPLLEDEVAAMVEQCLAAEIPTGLLASVAAANGEPLQVEELLLAFERCGALSNSQGSWQFEPERGALPTTVVDTTRVRLDELNDDDRRVIDAAALLGRTFDPTIVAAALEVAGRDMDRALRAALASGLLTPQPGALRPWFAHELVRDAVVADIGETTRRELACRLLATLERSDRLDDLERAAVLAVIAGDDDAASSAYARCGQLELARGLPTKAVVHFDAALEHTSSATRALPIREALLQALVLNGDVTRARAEADTVRHQLNVVGAEPERIDACVVASARAAANAAAWDEADTQLRALLDRDEPPASAEALGALVALERADHDRAGELARAVVERADATAEQRCEALEVLGRLARDHDLDDSAQWFDRAVATAEIADLDLWAARASHERATIAQLRSLGVAEMHQARERAVRAAAPGLTAAIDFHLAATHGVRFEPEPALDAARRLLDVARRLGAVRQEAWAWNLIGQAHAAAGDRARAMAASDEALAIAGDDDEIAAIAVGTARGLGSLLADDRDRAFAEVAEGVARLRRLPAQVALPPWYLWPLVATIYDLEGDGGAMARTETEHSPIRVVPGVDGLWHLADAVAHGRRRDPDGANLAAARAAERFAEVPAFAGYVHLGHRYAAEAALDDGWGQPAAWLGAAESWAADLGHSGLQAACASLGRRAGVPQRRRRRGSAEVPANLAALGVTSREVDVLRLVAEGLTNAEIAERLYLSPRTIKGYVENLLSKTGTANRTQLATFASDQDT